MKIFYSNKGQERYVAKVVRRSLCGADDAVIFVNYGNKKRVMSVDFQLGTTDRDLYDSYVYCVDQFEKHGIVNASAELVEREITKYGEKVKVQSLIITLNNIMEVVYNKWLMDFGIVAEGAMID